MVFSGLVAQGGFYVSTVSALIWKGLQKKVQEIDLFGKMRTMLRHFVEKLRVTMVTFGR